MLILPAIMLFATPPSAIYGYWETPAHSILRVEPCGPANAQDICLRVAKLPPDAPATHDINNPDQALHSRPICGLVVGTGFHDDGIGKLSGGHLYDPKSGHTYQGTITVEGNVLHLRGYLGISLFGRSETWHRTAPVPACQ
jgi:uncharacterized protein (DUF2147 family)